MFCKNCGISLPDDSKFCSSCGAAVEMEEPAAVETAEVATEAPVDTTAEVTVEPVASAETKKECICKKLSPILEKVKPLVEKYKLFLVGGAALLLMVLAICVIVGVCNSGNGFIAYENAILANVQDDELVVLWNNKVIETGIEASSLDMQAYNLDGTVYAALTEEGTLVVVNNKKVHVVSEDVVDFVLSAQGNGLAYVTEDEDEYSLNLYNVKRKKSTVVDDSYSILVNSLKGIELSPDGKMLAYYEFDEDEYESTLMLFTGKKSIKITSSDVELVGLSNKGKQIYVISENDDGAKVLYTYNKNGDRTKVSTCSGSSFYFNEDHTQILFYNDGKSYISTKGKEANKVSSGAIRLILSGDSSTFSAEHNSTYPVEDLYNHVYRVSNDNGYNLWLIKKNSNNSKKLVSNASNATLDAKCEYVYYINQDDDLCVLKISHGDKASDKAKTIAEDVKKFVVTSNRKKVYFISDGGLYSCNAKNGNGKKTIVSEDVSNSLSINAKDVVYYSLDGDLYACSNGRKGVKVLSDCEGLLNFPNGVVYAADEDYIYVTTGAKKLKKLFELD